MFHIYTIKFDGTVNLEKFLVLVRTKQGLIIWKEGSKEKNKIIRLGLACSENEHDYVTRRRKYSCKMPDNSFSRFG